MIHSGLVAALMDITLRCDGFSASMAVRFCLTISLNDEVECDAVYCIKAKFVHMAAAESVLA